MIVRAAGVWVGTGRGRTSNVGMRYNARSGSIVPMLGACWLERSVKPSPRKGSKVAHACAQILILPVRVSRPGCVANQVVRSYDPPAGPQTVHALNASDAPIGGAFGFVRGSATSESCCPIQQRDNPGLQNASIRRSYDNSACMIIPRG